MIRESHKDTLSTRESGIYTSIAGVTAVLSGFDPELSEYRSGLVVTGSLVAIIGIVNAIRCSPSSKRSK